MLGERANLPPALTPKTSALGLPFVPYHDDELRRRRQGRPMRSAYAADSQVRCRALGPLMLCRSYCVVCMAGLAPQTPCLEPAPMSTA